MKLQLTETDFVVNRLRELWKFDDIKPNHCILAGRVTNEVLTYFGIPHVVSAVQAMAMNDLMVSHMNEERKPDDWDPKAWSVGVGFPNMVAVNKDSREASGFDGHLVVFTRTHLLDLSAGQFDRPNHNIVTGGSILRPLTELSSRTFSGMGDSRFVHVNLNEGHLFFRNIETTSYKMSKDWRINYTRFSGPLIRTIKNEIKNI